MVIGRDLDLRHLRALDAVAAAGTFGRAARRLGYTQSAVSQQIAALERVVGEPLFDRPGGPRPVELTPLGSVLAIHAKDVLARVDAAATDIERFQAGVSGRIDIGTFQSVSTAVLPALLGEVRARRPEVEARLFETDDQDELIRRVLDGQLDVTFLVGDAPDELERVDLFVDPFVVVCLPPLTPDEPDEPVPIALLHGVPLIGEQDNACGRLIDDGLRDAGLNPNYVFRSSDNSAVAAMVRAGMGIAVLPLLAVDPGDPRIAVRELDPPIPPRRIAICWRRNRTLSPTAEHFVELAEQMTADLRNRALAPTPGG